MSYKRYSNKSLHKRNHQYSEKGKSGVRGGGVGAVFTLSLKFVAVMWVKGLFTRFTVGTSVYYYGFIQFWF